MPGSDALPNIQIAWQKVALRLQSIARMHEGVGVVSLSVIVKDGIPQFWTNPKIVMMEPKTSQEDLIRILAGDI